MKEEPYEKVLRASRIFPIFEDANDLMRAFFALSGMKPVGDELSELGEIGLGDPIGSIGVLADYVGRRIPRQVRPDRITKAHLELKDHADIVSEQIQQLRGVSESLLRSHRKEIMHRQFQQERICDAFSDIWTALLLGVGAEQRDPLVADRLMDPEHDRERRVDLREGLQDPGITGLLEPLSP